MIFKHITHKDYIASILAKGLLPAMATGSKRVWLTSTFTAFEWSIAHVSRHHGWELKHLREFVVTMPKTWARKSGRKGVWYSEVEILPTSLADVRHVLTMQG